MNLRPITSIENIVKLIKNESKSCFMIAIGGGVSVGKTTFANRLQGILLSHGISAQICSTDNFLKTNNELDRSQLQLKKGWPESYNWQSLLKFVHDFKRSEQQKYSVPNYCHKYYDILPNSFIHIEKAQVLILEGVVALNPKLNADTNLGIYLDADVDSCKDWFVQRTLGLIKDAVGKPNNFYHRWSCWDEDKVLPVIHECWENINIRNLNDNILQTKVYADLVIEKAMDHKLKNFEV